MSNQTLAIFGGSFDPPHLGHLEIIQRLSHNAYIDKIIVIPTFLNPFKRKFNATPEKRFEWTKFVFKDYQKVEVSDFEIRKNRVVYAIEWVRYFAQQYKNIILVVGSDNIKSLPYWRKYEELIRLVNFLIVERNGYKNYTSYPMLSIKNDTISSHNIRKELLSGNIPAGLIESIKSDVLKIYFTKENN